MTPDMVQQLTRGRRVFDLGVELFPGMPHVPTHSPFVYQMVRTHGDLMYEEGVSAAVDIFGMSCHTGTHLDSFGHFAKELRLHGGVAADQGQDKLRGLAVYGIQQVAPILGRGVLLDVAAARGVDMLDGKTAIGAQDLEAAARAAQVQIQRGDVVYVRTGWIKLWPDQRKYYSVQTGQPGLNLEAARWLTDQGVHCIGSDNFAVEQMPGRHAVHIHCLVEKGVHLLEVVNLEELHATKVYEFLTVIVPMKIRGGTASPVRPLAVV